MISVEMILCMYVCMNVAIHRPRAHHACTHERACAQIDAVKIASIDHVLTLNVVHQTTKPWELGL